MGIFDALDTAVSGLQAQSFALQNISGNIANSQTTAFKGTDTQFEELLSQQGAAPSAQTAGSVIASSSSTISVQGQIQRTSLGTNMAINGDGFFVVEKATSFTGGIPNFNGVNLYTRRGDFQVQNGYLVNGSGYYLMGVPIDPKTNNPIGSVPTLLQFQNNFLPAQQTTLINYGANLPTDPVTANTNATVPGSELLNPAFFISNPLAISPRPPTLTGINAALTPDAAASRTGTVDTSSYVVAAGGANLVINGVTIPLAAGLTSAQIATAITGSTAGVSASVNGSGQMVLTSANASTAIDIQSGSDANLLTGLGLTVGNTDPTNLLTQHAVVQGQTLIVQFGANPATTIVFGTAPNQVATMAQLSAALTTSLNGGTGSVNVQNGNVTLTSSLATDAISVTGTANPVLFGMQTTSALPPSQTVIGSDVTAFLNSSVGGGAITAYDQAGSPANIQFRWAKSDSASLGTGHSDVWNLFYATNSSATGPQAAWKNVGTNFTFAANGALSPPISNLTINNVNVNGVSLGNVQLGFAPGALTQFANTNGTVNVDLLQQNGYAAGSLQTLAVNDRGRIAGSYSNGQTVDVAEVTLASFSGESFLQNANGGAYAQTDLSGVPIYNASGTITPSSVEGSNTDIADQFTKLIVTQQAYSANAKVITTSNQMLQVVMNMVQ
jgi:flagellar hook protein FlgE